ncbi:hypothetical protein ACTOB_001234 [Actinoplanes oblitus]|uniref:HTH merR-type domain-containing protein n=1 Tax=Actinoplanes oblitus TaxID=3040509 RepID=A0ABY8WII4_9ACTN|nr:hypothetical protein [Actinoplanes oblitus]WIM97686.1 hypothetical protein ACTOB_001234 [Actinoplanes oblitus]
MTRRLIPTASAALALGVTQTAVRVLAHRGRLTRYGTAQRALYDLDEIHQLRPTTVKTTRSTGHDQQERNANP